MQYKINTKLELEEFIMNNWNSINEYIDNEFEGREIPLYNSVDIRESKEKCVPVDNNIYPSGFNNICLLDLGNATSILEEFILNINSKAKMIGILTESHTKNTFYLDHLAYLKKTLRDAGFDHIKMISFDNNLFVGSKTKLEVLSASKFKITLEKGYLKNNKVFANEEEIDFIILNNDQSSPISLDWDSITTPVHPSPHMGWYRRSKSQHFIAYRGVIEQFSALYSIDPNLLEAKFKFVNHLDFSTKEGLSNLALAVEDIKGNKEEMKIFIKGDQGTYGMGISVVSNGEDVLNINRKSRKKMNIGKNKIKFTSALVQEGIDTILKYDNMPAEVTVYLIAGKAVGGFMRANTEKSAYENLNSKGMVFKKFCMSEIRQHQDHKTKEAIYSVIARLSSLASTYEINNKG